MSPAAFSTPTMNSESESLLQSITSHGGYAYANMAARAAAGDQRAAETAREMAWEQLHSGPWHSVLPLWRDAYSMACLYVAKFHFCNGELTEALRALDMGIIMGGPLLRTDLDSAIEFVSAAKAIKSHNGPGSFKDDVYDSEEKLLFCPDEFDRSQVLSEMRICGKKILISVHLII